MATHLKASFEEICNVSRIGGHGAVDFNPTGGLDNGLINLALKEDLKHVDKDSCRRLLLCIDMQKDFIEGGSLPVDGSIADTERINRFIYNNMGDITEIMCSMDTHSVYQIFFPAWWRDANGNVPAPYTEITYDDVKNGKWFPIFAPLKSKEYLQGLEANSKKKLCIWPYHCINGSDGHSFENEFHKMVTFHAAARKTRPAIVRKGTDPCSEMYGIIKPEFSAINYKNTVTLNAIEEYDEIYVVGEAASHCLLESVRQIAEEYENRPEVTTKITVLEDCTSPIGGYEQLTKDTFDMFKKKYGIKFAKSTDINF